MSWASFDAKTWTAQQSVPGASGGQGPGLAGFAERLYMAYGPGVSDPMRWTSYDGKSWAEPRYVRAPSSRDPSPCSTNSRPWWRGRMPSGWHGPTVL